jgi:hypothetical protein
VTAALIGASLLLWLAPWLTGLVDVVAWWLIGQPLCFSAAAWTMERVGFVVSWTTVTPFLWFGFVQLFSK